MDPNNGEGASFTDDVWLSNSLYDSRRGEVLLVLVVTWEGGGVGSNVVE